MLFDLPQLRSQLLNRFAITKKLSYSRAAYNSLQ